MQHENTVELKNTITELQQERDKLEYELNYARAFFVNGHGEKFVDGDTLPEMISGLCAYYEEICDEYGDRERDSRRWAAAWKASAKDMRTTLIGMLAYDALPVISDEHLEPVPLTIQPVTLTMKGKVAQVYNNE